MHDQAAVQHLLNRWWVAYDEGEFDVWEQLLADDVWFTTRTDTGKHPHEAHIASDHRGAEAITWQREHRLAAPYPLRHTVGNVHTTAVDGDEVKYRAYLSITSTAGGTVTALSSAVLTGTVRNTNGQHRLSAVHVVLDTADPVPLAQRSAP